MADEAEVACAGVELEDGNATDERVRFGSQVGCLAIDYYANRVISVVSNGQIVVVEMSGRYTGAAGSATSFDGAASLVRYRVDDFDNVTRSRC